MTSDDTILDDMQEALNASLSFLDRKIIASSTPSKPRDGRSSC